MHFHQVVRGVNHAWYGLHRARCVVVLERCSCSKFDIASNRCRWTTRLIHLHHAWFNWCQWCMIGIPSGKAKKIRCIWFSQLWYSTTKRPKKWGRITAKFKPSLNQATSFVWTNALWQAKGGWTKRVCINSQNNPKIFFIQPKNLATVNSILFENEMDGAVIQHHKVSTFGFVRARCSRSVGSRGTVL